MIRMIRRRSIILCLTALLVAILVLNTYFIYMVVKENSRLHRRGEEIPYGPQSSNPKDAVVDEREVERKKKAPNKVPKTNPHDRQVTKVPSGLKKIEGNRKQLTPVKSAGPKVRQASNEAAENILRKMKFLNNSYYALKNEYKSILGGLLEDLKVTQPLGRNLWQVATKWINPRQITPMKAPALGSILRYANMARILQVESSSRGSQLKLQLTLEGGQQALFKPKWYSRDEVIRGPVYAGKDRHNAEIAAFHLGRLLGLHYSPVVVGRKLDLSQEVISVASPDLLATFFQEGNNTCLYGVCYYCKPEEPVCAEKSVLEGALVLFLPPNVKLKKYRSPWQRTYKDGVLARWESDPNYCTYLQRMRLYSPESSPRLLDLVSTAVFDFLLDNGDRHHYEVMANMTNSIVVLLDNGKSFGTPYEDHLDILAPLYQCCMIRKSFWQRLLVMTGGALSRSLDSLLKNDPVTPVLTSDHLQAIDRRLLKIISTVEWCFESKGLSYVLRDDGYR